MLINRYQMLDFTDDMKFVNNTMIKARLLGDVTTIDKMVRSSRDYIVSTPHFDIEQLLKVMKERCKTIAPNYRSKNIKYTARLEKLVVKMKKQ